MAQKHTKPMTSIRHIAVYVDEPEPGWFQWVLVEAASGPSTWSELKWAERWDFSYQDAMTNGLLALQQLTTDLDQGPRMEPRKPMRKAANSGFSPGNLGTYTPRGVSPLRRKPTATTRV